MTKETLLDNIINDLGANFLPNDQTVLEDILNVAINSALFASNRINRTLTDGVEDETKLSSQLDILFPEIKRCTKTLFLQRGSEDVKTQSLSGVSSGFDNAMETMRLDIIRNGKRVVI